MTLLDNALDGLQRGWSFTPLVGKRPLMEGWTRRSPSTEYEVRLWIDEGRNLGLRTGEDVFVIDVESSAADPTDGLDLPRTVTARTASGGWHYYFKGVKLGNTSRLLGEHTDTRGVGGQVVFPGSAVSSGVYRWEDGLSPNDVELAELPAELLERLTPRKSKPLARPVSVTPSTSAWATRALSAELDCVASAPAGEGNAHGTMCRASFKLGQVCGAGLLDQQSVVEQLVAAGEQAGWTTREARRVAHSGVEAGMGYPRGPSQPDVLYVSASEVQSAPPAEQSERLEPMVLLPGAHKLADGTYVKVGNDQFAEEALRHLDDVYRRDMVPGKVYEDRFIPLNEDAMRRECDLPRVQLVRWATVKVRDGQERGSMVQRPIYEPCNASNAKLVLSRAARYAPEIKLLTSYPVLMPNGKLSSPGFNVETGVFYSGPVIEPRADVPALLDLLADFPFEDDSSLANFIGLMLTPILRPFVGNAPLHLVNSPQAGTGKSRLIEQVFGITYLGRKLSSSQLPERTEERAKWLTALLLGGKTLLHMDNLTDELDSGNLASVLTSAVVSDRQLGSSTFVEMENCLTIAATGNNTQLSSELARRTVVVRLEWKGEGKPDERTEFRHPDSEAFIHSRRDTIMSCLVGMVQAWLDAGSPMSRHAPLGSFERWSAVIGGVLDVAKVNGHLGNRDRWRSEVDSEEGSLVALARAWRARFGDQGVTPSEACDALQRELSAILERPTAMTVGRMLARQVGRQVDGFVLRRGWSPNRNRSYSWEVRQCS